MSGAAAGRDDRTGAVAAMLPESQDSAVVDRRPEVLETVTAWARSWSEQRVDDYLAFYSSAFLPPQGLTREAWAATRRERILRPNHIEVSFDQLELRADGSERVVATFVQLYASDIFSDVATKTLELVWEEGRWAIAQERAEAAAQDPGID